MKKNKFLITAACLTLSFSAAATILNTQTDSLNYAIGLHNGMQLRAQQSVLSEPKAQEALLKAADMAFQLDSIPSELERVGQEVAIMFASQIDKGLADIKTWEFNAQLCFQGLVNGLYADSAVNAEADKALEFFQAQYALAQNDSAKQAVKQRKQKLVCPAKAAKANLKTTNDSINYAFGLVNGQQLSNIAKSANDKQLLLAHLNSALKKYNPYSQAEFLGSNIGYALINQREHGLLGLQDVPIEYNIIRQAVADGMKNDTTIFTLNNATEYLNIVLGMKQAEQQMKQVEQMKAEGENFLALNAQRPEVHTTPSGLQYEILREGTGTEHPTAASNVKVHYHGTLINGEVFDSSIERGEPISFPLNAVIQGWTEGVQLMTEGAKYRFYIPYQLAYGERGAGRQIPPYSALIFDVELLEIEK